MALTPTQVTRTDDLTGDTFLTFDTGGGDKAQGVVVVDENGAHTGIPGNELVVSVANVVSIDDSTPIEINIASQTGPLAIDDSTPISVAPASLAKDFDTNYSSSAAQASHSFSGATAVGEIFCVLDDPGTATAVCAMFFEDTTSLPANGTAPDWRIPISAGSGGYSFPTGYDVTTGYTVALSSTLDTLTVAGAEGYIHVRRT